MLFFVFKQKTAYEMRISDWSSDVCSSDLGERVFFNRIKGHQRLVTQDSFNFFTLLNDSALGFYLRRYFRRRILVLKKSRCWRGIRHEKHLPVRGQRSKTNAGTRKSRLA